MRSCLHLALIVAAVAVAVSCKPFERSWHYESYEVDTKKPWYCIKTGHRLIDVTTTEKQRTGGVEKPAEKLIEWGWMIKVENATHRKIIIAITRFELLDDDGSILDTDFPRPREFRIDPHQTTTLRGSNDGDYRKCRRAAGHMFFYRWKYVTDKSWSSMEAWR